jgi:hypothetical protein
MSTNWDFGAGGTNNGSVGFGSIGGISQGIYEESSAQNGPLGASLEFDDGRKYRYTKSAAGITIGNACSSDYSDGLLAELDSTTTVSATAGNDYFSLTGSGSQFSTTANFYAGGYIVFTDGTGAGQCYRIKSHTTASSDKITFYLYDALVTAPVAATGVMIVGNPFGAVLTADGTSSGAATDSWVVGVNPIAITSGYYFWAQTRGVAAVQFDAATTAAPHYGMELVMSDAHDGLVEAKLDAHDGYQTIGHYVGSTGDDNEYVAVHLTLE